MFQGLVDTQNLNFMLVFVEGLLSFFSPCVIPLLPVYMAYLAGGGNQDSDTDSLVYDRKRVFLHTVCFVAGISLTFFVLGFSAYQLGGFFTQNKTLLSRIGGILIILLGLVQVGFLELPFLQKERKFHLKFSPDKMNPLVALLMGFTFSFAWTPCIGPMLSSVLLLVSTAQNQAVGSMLILVYSVGFVVPFLILGLFTTQALNFFKNNRKLLKYTIKIGGVILIIMGVMTFTGWLNGISSYLNSLTPSAAPSTQNSPPPATTPETTPAPETEEKQPPTTKEDPTPAVDFTLLDQYGTEHKLSDYKGKVIFLNLWATWCGYCEKEMPDIQAIYEEYGSNEKDVIILGLANPKTSDYPNNADVSQPEIEAFLEDGGFTYPVVFDNTGEAFQAYYMGGLPSTIMIDADGNIFGGVSGMITKDMMKNIIEQTISGNRR